MSDQYVEGARDRMGAIQRLLKGLPGISGYTDKELRRDADKRVRDLLAGQLEEQKAALFGVQQLLLENKGLLYMDNVDNAVTKLQILIDRIKTASYGYAGLFDPMPIREEQLEALYRFDTALVARVVDVQQAIEALRQAVTAQGDIAAATRKLTDLVAQLNTDYNKRHEAVLQPGLLNDATYAPSEVVGLDTEPGMQTPPAVMP